VLTEASAARLLLFRLQGCFYNVFSECMDFDVCENFFGTLIYQNLYKEKRRSRETSSFS
jgi:hypothetical protein